MRNRDVDLHACARRLELPRARLVLKAINTSPQRFSDSISYVCHADFVVIGITAPQLAPPISMSSQLAGSRFTGFAISFCIAPTLCIANRPMVLRRRQLGF